MGWTFTQDEFGSIEGIWVDEPERPELTKEEVTDYYEALKTVPLFAIPKKMEDDND